MSNSSQRFWSDNPYAPRISHRLYLGEKENFAGNLIGAILYGIVVVLFFRCMGALLKPVNCTRGSTRWGLVAHTVAMFSFVTVYTAMSLHIHSISYVDNRNFPSIDNGMSGPLGYQLLIYPKAINVVPNAMFSLNQWLADGLLLYRCYIIYSMNLWVVAFPCLMYLASSASGIAIIYHQIAQPNNDDTAFGIPYFSISISLNVLLTLMIAVRLIRHSKEVQDAIGPLVRPGRLYKAIIAILVESCALYIVSFLLYIGPWASHDGTQLTFFPILTQTQVIAPFLIILRAANYKAFTSDTIYSQDINTIQLAQGNSADNGIDQRAVGTLDANEGILDVRFATVTTDSCRSET